MIQQQLQQAKDASLDLQGYSQQQVNDLLLTLADAIMANKDSLLSANQQDLDRMEQNNPLYDRLKLTESRLEGIASDMRNVVKLPSPLGKTLSETTLPNGLEIKRVSVPFGVIGIVYEARPNVTFDVFSLCLKSGNVCVLKGGKDADSSNRAIVSLIKAELERQGLNPHVIELLPATHEATGEMLQARNFIDVVIPRGSSRLINFVRETASVPVIETGAGVCHAYIDRDADLKKAIPVIVNAKTRRVSVCNALDCMIIDQNRLADLTQICQPLFEKGVEILADNESYSVLSASQLGTTYASLLKPATEETFGTEFLAMRMAIKTVDGVEAAIRHIRQYGSGHSECIVTENQTAADEFLRKVDAACVYHNAPTSFTDGAQFGLGAEIGISTQKLHARGPMALEAMTTYKWIVKGEGQVRG